MPRGFAIATIVALFSTQAFAQGFVPLPNQLSVGVGVVGDRQPNQHRPTATLSLAWADSGERKGEGGYHPYRLGFVIEAELGSRSDVELCQASGSPSTDPPNCTDAALLFGLRFHLFRRRDRRVIPFVNFLFGPYWRGSGVEDRKFLSMHSTLQGGGGIDLRRTGSVHGLRLSVDYRGISTTGTSEAHEARFGGRRRQLRFMTSYVLGPAEPRPPTGG